MKLSVDYSAKLIFYVGRLAMTDGKRLLFNAFVMNSVGHITQGSWRNPNSREVDYLKLDTWLDLARLLERGKFDAMFLADQSGIYDKFGGGPEAALRTGMQVPINEPMSLVPALATVTEHLGFAFTSGVLQEHPFNFARRVSTLDHLTNGRVAWNIVTSYLDSTGRNFGYDSIPSHEERYARAREYLDVAYKLWEGSWEDDAVVRDPEAGIYTDPAKVHTIDHEGTYYRVAGPHQCEPSPQRTPVLFQAGASPTGRGFAAEHAEAVFIWGTSPSIAQALVTDLRARAVDNGRRPEDLKIFQGLGFVVGATEEEARRKYAEIAEYFSEEGHLTMAAGSFGIDLASFDLDRPLRDFTDKDGEGMKSIKEMFGPAVEDGTLTLRKAFSWSNLNPTIVGTPEQIADELEQWSDAGIDGVNMFYLSTPGSFVDFIDGVVPVLQDRGLMQREYSPGTLREKLFPDNGPRFADRHPGARYGSRSIR